MLNLADKVQEIETEDNKPIAGAVEVTETKDTKWADKQQIIAEWRRENRNNYIALQVLCVFLGAVLIKFFEYLFR